MSLLLGQPQTLWVAGTGPHPDLHGAARIECIVEPVHHWSGFVPFSTASAVEPQALARDWRFPAIKSARQSVMHKISKSTVAASLALTVGLLYSLCGVVVAVAPGALGAALRIIAHGLNISVLAQSVPTMSFAAFLLGLLTVTVYSFVAGYLYALVHNLFARDSSG